MTTSSSSRLITAIVLTWLLLVTLGIAQGENAASIESVITLQNDGDYRGSTDDVTGSTIRLYVSRSDRAASGTLLRFGHLGEYLRGERIEVLDAHVELFYKDETWTLIRYDVAAFRSTDGTLKGVAQQPEGHATIVGDKWPPGTRTAIKSWISIPIPASTIQSWLEDDGSNYGLVLTVDSARMGPEQARLDLAVSERLSKGPFVSFGANGGPASERPRLVIRYRVNGNVPPQPPLIARVTPGALIASPVSVRWDATTDPDSNAAVTYQFQAGRGPDDRIQWPGSPADLLEPGIDWDIDADRLRLFQGSGVPEQEQLVWFRARSVDSLGATSRWVVMGPVGVSPSPWTVWVVDGNRKVWSDAVPPAREARKIRIYAARNEWEPFQIVVDAHVALKNLRLKPSALAGPGGARLGPPTVYREHFIPIEATANTTYGRVGMVPDALVPVVNPESGRPTEGLYGGDRFDVAPGGREVFWLDSFVAAGTAPGIYRGSVEVQADGMAPETIQVELEVWDFVLPGPKQLVACFQMGEDAVAKSHDLRPTRDGQGAVRTLARHYEAMLHEHYISNWSPITGFNYGLNGVRVTVKDDVVSTDWQEFDELVTPYMDGSAFADGVPSQCLFVPYWLPTPKKDGTGWAARVNESNFEGIRFDLFAQFVKQLEEHLRSKGWLDKAYVFYFDEPFISKWKYKAYIDTAKVIRQFAPHLRIMLTDGYRGQGAYDSLDYITEPIEKYVDVWNPVTFQVSSPELAEYYRQRKRDGEFDMWCQTLANANPNRAVINLFPEFDMPFHRMWGVLSWSLGFQGIEWWQTIVWWDSSRKRRIDPWTDATAFPGFRQPLNGDGRLFYPGHKLAIGSPEIPIATLRMKAIREAIEDYEYLDLLTKAGADSEFDLDRLYTFDKSRARRMRDPMPMGKGPWHWWEGDPDVLMAARREIAALILDAQENARREAHR